MAGFVRSVDRARSIVGCVTHARLLDRPLGFSDEGRTLFLADAGSVRGSGSLRGATIEVETALTRTRAGDAEMVARYAYSLLDRQGVELLAWHFHPDSGLSPASAPHLHVSASLRPADASGGRGMIPLDKRHLPTGVVPLAAFVRMLIEEFGVEPLALDWQARLADA